MQIYGFVLTSILLGSIGQVLLKLGTMKANISEQAGIVEKIIGMFLHPITFIGFVIYGLSSLFWLVSLSKMPLSKIYPMIALGYVIVFILSIFLFDETVSVMKVVALALIVLGVLLLAKFA